LLNFWLLDSGASEASGPASPAGGGSPAGDPRRNVVKTARHLYPRVHDFENLYRAYRKARKGKRGQPEVATFEFRLEDNLVRLQEELAGKTYRHGAYRSFAIHEAKRRLISAAEFRDRVVHHALQRVVGPVLERGFIHDSYANRVGKGTHRALDRAQQFARRNRYVLPCDVRQFFPSIDHAILRGILARRLADAEVMWLVDRILESGAGVLSGEYEMVYFAGDDLLAAARPRGLPIGNLCSQHWANVYLNEVDQFVKRELKVRCYLRYVDDMLLFGDDKARLWAWRAALVDKLAGLRLTLHGTRAQPRPVTEGIPFLGFVVFPTHRRLKRRKGIAFRRKLRRLVQEYQEGRIDFERLDASVQGWINHVRYGDTWGLRKALFAAHPIPRVESSGRRAPDRGGA
jgi:RNA-directed DNA polymerase